LRPQALPVRTSFQSSLNQRFSAAPFSVLRTATGFLLPTFGYSTRGIRRREDFIRRLHLTVTVVFDRTAFLKRNGLHFAHASALHHRILPLVRPRCAIPQPRTLPPFLNLRPASSSRKSAILGGPYPKPALLSRSACSRA